MEPRKFPATKILCYTVAINELTRDLETSLSLLLANLRTWLAIKPKVEINLSLNPLSTLVWLVSLLFIYIIDPYFLFKFSQYNLMLK